jgi:hypothetical protein
MMATQFPLTDALSIAPLSVDLFAMVQCPKTVRQSAEMGSLLVTRPVTMATQIKAMAAAAPVFRRRDGPAPTPSADRQAAAKFVATTSKLLARNVMMATLPLVTGVRTSASWTVGTRAAILMVRIKPLCVRSSAATAWLQPRKRAMMATLKKVMDATDVL